MSDLYRYRLDKFTLVVYLQRGVSLDAFPGILSDIFDDLHLLAIEQIRYVHIVFFPQDVLDGMENMT